MSSIKGWRLRGERHVDVLAMDFSTRSANGSQRGMKGKKIGLDCVLQITST